jgi:hypothetical protein
MRRNQTQTDIERLLQELATPLHSEFLCDTSRHAIRGREADLAAGHTLAMGNVLPAANLRPMTADFDLFMRKCMGVRSRLDAYPIRMAAGKLNAPEAFQATIRASGCDIAAGDLQGVRRALIWLEDEMTVRRAPCLPLGTHARWATVVDRITHSPCAVGRWGTGWELEDDEDYYPDEYLNKLAHCGINGIWVAGLLRRLVASKVLPELGPRRHVLGKLNRLVERARPYGIGVYLFCIEPRAVPRDHLVFRAHPEIEGARMCEVTSSLCTSTPLVHAYIRDVMRTLFTEVPDLAGVINIFNGERGTTCWPNPDVARTCPRCRERRQSDVLAEELSLMIGGMRQGNPAAKLLAWTYCMDAKDSMTAMPVDPMLETIEKADKDIIWLGNFEHGGSKKVRGKTIAVHEYSLSYAGPSPSFRGIADTARERGARCYAKLQIGTSYELSSEPYIPAPGMVYDKFAGMRAVKAGGAMVSWIIGGYPGPMLKAAGEAAFVSAPASKRMFLRKLAGCYGGERAAPHIARAWERFDAAFRLYPCSNKILYFSPITRCPAYHLDLRCERRLALPYNWGIDFSRRAQPYEQDVARWAGPLTAAELSAQFRRMGRNWSAGLAALRAGLSVARQTDGLRRHYAVAAAVRLQFLSVANVIEFYSLRDRAAGLPSGKDKRLVVRMRKIVADDIALAREMKRTMAADPFLGFESEMHAYSFSPVLLETKVRQSRKTVRILERWIKTGERPRELEQAVPAADVPRIDRRPSNRVFGRWLQYCLERESWKGPVPALPTYRDWLLHGD